MKDSYLAVFFCFVFSVMMARTSDQIYARIVDQTMSNEMDKLSAKLSETGFSLNGGDSEGGEAVSSTASSVSAFSAPNI